MNTIKKILRQKMKKTKNEDDQKFAKPFNRHSIDTVAPRFVFT